MRFLKEGLLAVISSVMITSSLYSADEFKALPIFFDGSYCTNTEVALVVGGIDFDNSAFKSGNVIGMEVSLDCPVFTLPGNNLLRQQFSLNRYSKKGFKITTLEINPYYFLDLAKDMVLGFGPGLGYAQTDVNDKQTSFLTYQVGAGIKYYLGQMLIGVDVRWQGSTEKDFLGTGTEQDLENTRAMLKVGYLF